MEELSEDTSPQQTMPEIQPLDFDSDFNDEEPLSEPPVPPVPGDSEVVEVNLADSEDVEAQPVKAKKQKRKYTITDKVRQRAPQRKAMTSKMNTERARKAREYDALLAQNERMMREREDLNSLLQQNLNEFAAKLTVQKAEAPILDPSDRRVQKMEVPLSEQPEAKTTSRKSSRFKTETPTSIHLERFRRL